MFDYYFVKVLIRLVGPLDVIATHKQMTDDSHTFPNSDIKELDHKVRSLEGYTSDWNFSVMIG